MAGTLPRMDNEDVDRGAVVYDIVKGSGTVRHIYPDGRVGVEFASEPNKLAVYSTSTGRLPGARQRTLFWSQPYIVPPPKQRSKYDAYQQIASTLAALVSN